MQRHTIANEPEPLYELLSRNFQTSNAARKYYTSAMQSRVQILHAHVHACMHQASRSWRVEEAAQAFIVPSRYLLLAGLVWEKNTVMAGNLRSFTTKRTCRWWLIHDTGSATSTATIPLSRANSTSTPAEAPDQ